MKTTTIFTSQFLGQFEQLIFITKLNEGWETEWEILLDDSGLAFLDLNDAIIFVREKKWGWGLGLADFEQARCGNAEWDNL